MAEQSHHLLTPRQFGKQKVGVTLKNLKNLQPKRKLLKNGAKTMDDKIITVVGPAGHQKIKESELPIYQGRGFTLWEPANSAKESKSSSKRKQEDKD